MGSNPAGRTIIAQLPPSYGGHGGTQSPSAILFAARAEVALKEDLPAEYPREVTAASINELEALWSATQRVREYGHRLTIARGGAKLADDRRRGAATGRGTPAGTMGLANRLIAAALAAGVPIAAVHHGAVAQQRQEARVDRVAATEVLLQNFDRMAFGDETERAAWSAVQRWTTPVRAVLIGDNAEAYRADVRALFAELARLTGVPFTLSDGDSDANLRIFFSARDWYRSAAGRAFARPEGVVCFTSTAVDQQGAIATTNTVIPEDLSGRAVRSCLAHELMHAIGFQGHPARTFESALRNGTGFERLTMNDRILIRALYDSRLKTAMNADEALAIARELVPALVARVQGAADPLEVLGQGGGGPLAPAPWQGGPI